MRSSVKHIFASALAAASLTTVEPARADFLFKLETDLRGLGPPQTKTAANSVDLKSVTLQDTLDQRGGGGNGPYGAAFGTIEPFTANDPSVINIRARATASSSGFDGMNVSMKATIQDRIRATWLGDESRPEFVWAAVFRLTGSLQADRSGLQTAHYSHSNVLLYGGSLNDFFQVHTQGASSSAGRIFDGEVFVSTDPFEENYFSASGGLWSMQFTFGAISQGLSSAVTDFPQGAGFLGFQALDAQGKVIPGIAEKIRLTADSGGSYRFLESLPAVPEPSSFVATGIGLALVGAGLRGRNRRRAG